MVLLSRVDHYENFPVASVLCPRRWRAAVVALYRFARTADNLADEDDSDAQQRLAALAALRRAIKTLWQHEAVLAHVNPAWTRMLEALAHARAQHQLPLAPLEALLDAFEQDVRWRALGRRYRDDEELLAYCARSANPIGRLMLHLVGIDTAEATRESDALCTALQLINICQDVGVDLPRGRCYLTDTWLRNAGLDPEQAPESWPDAPLAQAVAQGCALAAQHLRRAWPLPQRIGGRFGWELRLVTAGASTVLERIAACGYQTRHLRPRLHPWDTPALLWRARRHRLPALVLEINP